MAGLLAGGINLHLIHHLFPHWNHRHYPELAQIAAVAARYDYQYLSLTQLLSAQRRFLHQLGKRDNAACSPFRIFVIVLRFTRHLYLPQPAVSS
ncbi:hypothetical protein [Candidatus Erwinia dacicola]|uniref:hypothetical protein n=1 Tax=Candidatus Erwinia dacicola TaxID=252393 RepID=UPI001FDF3792|nr:hypothetical protein [Candidatus Erwinia dacicola]